MIRMKPETFYEVIEAIYGKFSFIRANIIIGLKNSAAKNGFCKH